MALILAVSRYIVGFDRRLRRSKKVGQPTICGGKLCLTSSLNGKTVGIVGMGRIGKDVARKLKGFNTKIVYSDVMRADAELEKELNATYLSFEELLKTADFITVHCPYTPESHHLSIKRRLG